jgi:NitT/TauT family transport system permease protein
MQADTLAPAVSATDARRWAIRAAQLALFAATLVVWQLASHNEKWRASFSSPSEVFARLAGWLFDRKWWPHLWATLESAFLGYLLGLVVALLLVAVITPSEWITRFFSPFIAALNALPKVALAPLFIFWFGTTLQSKVYFVASVICFTIFYGIQVGLRTIDPVLRDNVRMLGASRSAMVVHLYMPAILTWIIASLRLSIAFALLAAVISEYMGSIRGLGYLIAYAQQTMQPDSVIAGILVVSLVVLSLDRTLLATEARMSAWRAF